MYWWICPGMGKVRDRTVPRYFVPVPLVPRNSHAGQSRENNQINASNWIQGQRDLTGFALHRIPGQGERPWTDRDSCPEMSGFVVPRDFSIGTVPQIFVPVPTVPWLWVPVPIPIMVICGTGPGSRHYPGTTAHPWICQLENYILKTFKFYSFDQV